MDKEKENEEDAENGERERREPVAGSKETRTHKVTIGLSPSVYERVLKAAEDYGIRPSTWIAYTVGSAAMAHAEMRAKMTDQMVALMANAIAEGEADGSLPK